MANTGTDDGSGAAGAAQSENIDLRAVLRTIRQPFLVLDRELTVERANPAFFRTFDTTAEETEGRKLHDLGNDHWDIPQLRRLLEDILPDRGEVSDYRVEHEFGRIGRRVMLLNAYRMERGAHAQRILLTIEDITERERLRRELEGQKEYAEKIVDASRNPLLILGLDLRVKSANATFYEHFHADPDDTEGRLVYELGNGQWDIPRLRELLEGVLPDNDAFDDFEVRHEFEGIGQRTMLLNARKIDHMQWILLEIEDRTEALAAADALRRSQDRQEFLLRLADALHDLGDPAEITHVAALLLAEHLGASQAYYVEMPRGRDFGEVFRDHAAAGLSSLAGRYPFDGFRSTYDQLKDGRVWIVPDVLHAIGIDAREREVFRANGVVSWLDVPLIRSGELIAALCVVQDEARDWTEHEIALVQEVAERCRSAVERGQAEALLEETRERFDHIVSGARDYAIFTMDADGRVTTWPPGASEVFGGTEDEMLGASFAETFVAADVAAGEPQAELETAARDGVAADVRWHRRRDGTEVFIDGETIRLGAPHDIRGYIKIGQDATARRQSEERVAASEARLKAIFEGATVGLSEIDRDGRILRWNAELARMLGRSSEEMEHVTVPDVTHPEDLPESLAMIGRVLSDEAEAAGGGVDKRYIRPDGTLVWANSRATLLSGEGDAPATLLVVTVDLTHRRAAEAAVRESEERFRQFGDASLDALWIRDAETLDWEYLSPSFDRIYGMSRDRALADPSLRTLMGIILPEDRDPTLAAIRSLREGDARYEYRIRRPSDGAVRWLRTNAFRLGTDGSGRQRLGGITHDMTDEKQAADRLEVLLAELQHRTRNIVGVVQSMAARTVRSSDTLDEFKERFADRLKALARVNSLLSSLAEGERVAFDDLIDTEFRAHGLLGDDGLGAQVTAEGPRGIALPSASVQTLALALHELLTNAVKHGALSVPEGHLAVRWEISTGRTPWLRFDWAETGMVLSESDLGLRPGGYGRELIERALPYQLGAETTYELSRDGLHCAVMLPLPPRRTEAKDDG